MPLQIAWSVARTNSSSFFFTLPFPVVIINEGGPWRAPYNEVRITRSGLYFIHMSVGVPARQSVNYSLQQSSSYVFDIYRPSTRHTGVDTLSRTGMLQLTVLTRLTIRSNPTYSDSRMQTSFMGFLIQ